MNKCEVSKILAYLSTTYIMASFLYLVITHFIGTPLKDAISKHPELMKIKMKSSYQRKMAFLAGIGGSIVLLMIWKPFDGCKC